MKKEDLLSENLRLKRELAKGAVDITKAYPEGQKRLNVDARLAEELKRLGKSKGLPVTYLLNFAARFFLTEYDHHDCPSHMGDGCSFCSELLG